MESTIKKRGVGTNLTEGPIFKTLLLFAIPIILTNLIQQLYGMVDLMVIGQFVGSAGTVGVSTGGEMADLVTPVAMGFSTAGQIFIAQLAGARDDRRIKDTVGTLLTFMLGLSFVLVLVGVFFCKPILQLLNCPAEALGQAEAYMVITVLGFPFIFGYNAICGVLRGMGESKRPLLFIIVAAVVNIVFDLVLVVGFDLQAAGTAIATTLSQLGSFLAALIYLYKRREKFDFVPRLSYFKVRRDILWVLIKLGIPQVVRSMLVRFSLLWINANVNAYGLVVSATNSVGNKIQKFAEVFIQGVDTASAAMIGQNLGAKKPERAKKVTWATLALTLSCAVVVSLLCVAAPSASSASSPPTRRCAPGGGLPAHHDHPLFLLRLCGRVPGHGHRLRLRLAGLCHRHPGRRGVQDRPEPDLRQPDGHGLCGLFSRHRLLAHPAGLLCFAYFLSGRWRTRKLLSERGVTAPLPRGGAGPQRPASRMRRRQKGVCHAKS